VIWISSSGRPSLSRIRQEPGSTLGVVKENRAFSYEARGQYLRRKSPPPGNNTSRLPLPTKPHINSLDHYTCACMNPPSTITAKSSCTLPNTPCHQPTPIHKHDHSQKRRNLHRPFRPSPTDIQGQRQLMRDTKRDDPDALDRWGSIPAECLGVVVTVALHAEGSGVAPGEVFG